ncbi:MAG: DNA repair protein RecN [Clostridia bacterium]|nr:DNA repair protein RecN [Clostridia bacterium]
MINHILIRNFAIIEDLEVDFEDGLNIITGETGAGKSIVVEAISLALGARADSSYIRHGADKAQVQLIASLDEEEYILYREITNTGKNICKVNGELVPLSQLKELSLKLADIHGQYDNQFLLNPDNHIEFVDQYANLQGEKALIELRYRDLVKASKAYKDLINGEKDAKEKLEFYKYQLQDIDKLNLKIGEDEELEERINLLQNAEKIYENLDSVYSKVYLDSPSVVSSLYSSLQELEAVAEYSKTIEDIKAVFQDAYYNIDDLGAQLRNMKDSIDFNGIELDNAISRLQDINNAKAKYGKTIEEVLEYRNKINLLIGEDVDFEHSKAKFKKEMDEAKEAYLLTAEKLSELRKDAALKLEYELEKELKELNFSYAKIKINFEKAETASINGMDIVEILISTNAGEPVKALNKIASGGEMSRIMLAFKNITNTNDGIYTLFFDEIDNGISGITASIVAQKLKDIANNHQIICITHLPQIAASGTTNYRIKKLEEDGKTSTTLSRLNGEEKVKEIARLLGGTNITDTTIKSAQELIEASI